MGEWTLVIVPILFIITLSRRIFQLDRSIEQGNRLSERILRWLIAARLAAALTLFAVVSYLVWQTGKPIAIGLTMSIGVVALTIASWFDIMRYAAPIDYE